MAGSVILAGARTPIGKLSGALAGLQRRAARWHRHQGRPRTRRARARPGRLRLHGPRAPGRHRADHRPPGRGRGRHPDDRSGDDGQQGLPVGAEHHPPRRPRHPERRGRDRRRRRHGVDDPSAARAAGQPGRVQVRRRDARRLAGLRRTVLRLRQARDGRSDREVRGVGRPRPRAAGRARRRRATSGRHARSRTDCSPTRSHQCRSHSGEATPSCSTPTKASAATRPSTPSPRCARRSTRPATSPPATPHRSATAASAVDRDDRCGRRASRHHAARRDRRLRPSRRTRPLAADPAGARDQGGRRASGHRARGHLPLRAQRGLRRGRLGVDGRPRHRRRDRQRQRRRHRPRPPDRHERTLQIADNTTS